MRYRILMVVWTALTAMACPADESEFRKILKDTFTDKRSEAVERLPLWPGGAPGAKGEQEHDIPTIDPYLPGKPDSARAAVVVLPGGGYASLAIGHEGRQVAEFFDRRGVAAFVVRYRLGSHGYRHPVQMHDAQRAVRFVRAGAERWNIDPDRIGIMGFSAGGHLASTVATHFDSGDPDAADPIDRVSCRPDFAILCYPVITLGEQGHAGSRHNLLGPEPDAKQVEHLSSHLQVTAETPPTFLFHTDADRGVVPENSVLFYMGLRKAGVPAELHIYRVGRHGVGLAGFEPLLRHWPQTLLSWMRGLELIAEGS